MPRRLCLALAVPTLLIAAPAFAEAEGEAAAPVATRETSTDDQIAAYLRDLPPATPAPWSETYGPAAPYDDRRPHTELEVAVGSQGYRSLYARQTLPVGQTGTLDLAFQTSSFKGRGGGRNSMTGLSVGLDFSKRDACDAREPAWRRHVLAPPPGCFETDPGRR